MPNARFIANTKAKELRVELWLNDIPVIFLPPGHADESVSIPLNDNILPGTNRLGVMRHSGPVASRSAENWANRPEAASYTSAGTLEIVLGEYQVDQPAHKEGPTPIHTIDWAGAAEPAPVLMEREFSAAGFGRWLWQDATPYAALDDNVRAGAVAYLMRLHT